MLETREVLKRYADGIALEGVSISVAHGQCVALVGESGSGKTTLLRMFNRMVEPDQGIVLCEGRDIQSLDPIQLRRQTGYVQQDGGLLPHWSVLRNASMVPVLRGMPEAETLASQALEQVGLPVLRFGHRRPSELSGGQRQRLAIARAIAARPQLLLLDEPFGALDALTRGEVREAFADLRRELDLTSVIVTHDLSEAVEVADQIAVLRTGGIEQVGAPSQLLEHPNHGYVARLLHRSGVGPELDR